MLGDPIVPQRALQIGLISHVSPAGSLTADADALVGRILQLEPNSAWCCKFFQTAQQNSFDQNCRLSVEALTVGSMAMLARGK